MDDISFKREGNKLTYEYVTLDVDADQRQAKLHILGPKAKDAEIPQDPTKLGSSWYAMKMWNELNNAILQLRHNFELVGMISITTEGDPKHVIALDNALWEHRTNWFVREVLLLQGRVLKRLDVTARSFFALIQEGSCFSGSTLEIALASDRIYMMKDEEDKNLIGISVLNGGQFKMSHGLSRLENRFYEDESAVKNVMKHEGKFLTAKQADDLGLTTAIPDDLDWDDEVRVAIEERASMSPDALTGMEANLRFVGPETMESRIFGRLSAWQNWIFIRPNATGEQGALTSYGKTTKAKFDWRRT